MKGGSGSTCAHFLCGSGCRDSPVAPIRLQSVHLAMSIHTLCLQLTHLLQFDWCNQWIVSACTNMAYMNKARPPSACGGAGMPDQI